MKKTEEQIIGAENSMQDGGSIVREVMEELVPEQIPAAAEEKRHIPLTHRVWAKAAAFILAVVMAAVTVASVVGMVCLIEFEVYTTPKESCRREVMGELAESVVWDLAYCVMAGDEEEAVRRIEHKNIAGIIIDLRPVNGECWTYGNTRGDGQQASYESRWLVLGSGEVILDHGHYTEEEIKEMSAGRFTAAVYLPAQFTEEDEFFLVDMALDAVYALRYWIYAIGLGALVLAIICFIFLMCASGRRGGLEEPQPGWATRVPFDVTTAAAAFALMGMIAILSELSYFGSDEEVLVIWALCGIAALAILLGWCMSAALRLKLGRWWENTVIFLALRFCLGLAGKLLRGAWRCVRWIASLLRRIPLVWKSAAGFAAVALVEFFYTLMFLWDADMLLLGWFFERSVLFAAVIYIALALRRLQKGGEALAAGDLSHQVDTKWMLPDFKRHAENLGSIGEGMTAAVEQRLKSERMKTELITNVSHDIKTPLTSIINYSDLIGKEQTENEKITEYAAVLHRQSERLKRLIEDLVEASKASTGNLEVLLAPCEVGVMLSQTAGEYEQRLEQCALTLVTKQPDVPVKIMADGRRLWRVFDNLMNNICKYAMPGTRVYLSLEEQNGQAVISFKNTSREPLDLTADELAERFVRGDAARNSEGNGLGLSIARSLTQLQNGSLELTVDGDLFKAVLKFPTI